MAPMPWERIVFMMNTRRDWSANTGLDQVMVLGWLGLFPMIVFAAKYANGTHDDFEYAPFPGLISH